MEKIYDVIIIGSGPGGMTAALYASRANLSVLILERGMPGGEMLNTAEIENYPGFLNVTGPELSEYMYKSAMNFGAEYAYGDVSAIELNGNIKIVHAGKKVYHTYSIIIATGAHHKKLHIEGEEQYSGRGVSYCAVCDGAFFKDKELIVVGGGDSAVEEGIYLTQFAKKVTIVHRRDTLRAQKILQNRAFNNDKIAFIWDSTLQSIQGENGVVTQVALLNHKTGETTYQRCDGIFIYVGILPNSKPFESLHITNEEGWINTNEKMETAISGIFAIGDVRHKGLRQVITAVGDGGIAGQEAYHYIEKIKEME